MIKILYIEDLNPGTIIHDLTENGFEVKHHQPILFEDALNAVNGYDLLLIDFRLTDKTALFDAPTIAQTLRTLKSSSHKDIPIVLISSEANITDYYNDLTSRDLFDISLTKSDLLKDLGKYSAKFKSLISGYETIRKGKFNPQHILKISDEEIDKIDYRILEKLKGEIFSNDIFAFSSFVLNNLIRIVGVLIGEDVLSARLGISKKSPDWEKLKEQLEGFRYKGVYSDYYNRWWSYGLLEWWKKNDEEKTSLRRLSSEQRVKKIVEITKLNLEVQPKTKYAKSSHYWTICKETELPIDPLDGLELYKRELLPWQETEYISIQAGLEPEQFNASDEPIFQKYLKPLEKKRLMEIVNTMRNGTVGN